MVRGPFSVVDFRPGAGVGVQQNGASPAVHIDVDWVGFSIPNEFVVGYGLDYNELYRNLPYIGVLKPSVYGGE